MPDDGISIKKRPAVLLDYKGIFDPAIECKIKGFAADLRLPALAIDGFTKDVMTAYCKATGACRQVNLRPHRHSSSGAADTTAADAPALFVATYKPMGDRTLPNLPPGLAWPKETYSGSPEAQPGGGGIVPYLDRVWLPLLQAGVATRRILDTVDSSATMAITNYKRPNPKNGERRSLPERLHFPTLKEVNDAIVASAPDVARVAATRGRYGLRTFDH